MDSNTMEKDAEFSQGIYDFGARIYDSRLGKFLSIDPLHAQVLFQSPYVLSNNTPISSRDINGEKAYLVIWFSTSETSP